MTALASYEYRAIDKAGAERRGVVSAPTREDAYRKVAAGGATPVRLREVRARRARFGSMGRIRSRDVAQFTYQLAVLMEARIPLADGVRGIAEQEPHPRFRAVMMDVAAQIQAGSGVATAMSAHRAVFGDVFLETIRAAEQSGNMIKSLEHLAEMLERRDETSRQVKQAMTYPVVVLIGLSVAVLFLVVFVIPKFAAMFASRGVDLPMLTRALQGFGLSVRHFWWAYAACAGCAAFGARKAWANARTRARIDRLLNHVPYLNRALVGLAVGRFARVFGLGLGSGLGLLESLETSGRAAARPLLMDDVEMMMDQVRQGGRLSEVLRTCRYLPVFARRMLAAGEESAELPRMCGIIARHYERDTAALIKSVATVVEPLLIALLTGVVLVVALAIFLPMWDMVGLVK